MMSENTEFTYNQESVIQPGDGRPALLGRNLEQLTELVTQAGFPAFRAKQLHHWLYNKAALSFDEMQNLAREYRRWLEENFVIGHNEIAQVRYAEDETKKILFGLQGNKVVESVLMPERDWFTLCVSSQVGCAVGCTFCMTGFGGFQRQLTSAEILSQVLLTKRLVHDNQLPRNLVFMGMGEPMLNLDNVIPALKILADPDAISIASRRITVSTSGIIPGIIRLGEADTGVNIAISLNAPNNELRSQIMPINRKYPIEQLIETCRSFPLRNRRRITFEYVLLGGFNDSLSCAKELASLLHGLQCKVNLIPWNPDSHLPFQRPSEETVRRFQDYLLDRYFTVSIRYSKGVDIGAACGQLAGHWQAKQGVPAA